MSFVKSRKKIRKIKAAPSLAKFKKLIIPRPDVLHGFLRHNEINLYLEYLQNRYNFVQVHTIGTTFEHRHLKALEIDWNCRKNISALQKESRNLHSPKSDTAAATVVLSKKEKTKTVKMGQGRNFVFIEGGTHAREWITVSVALNCIYQLTEKNIRNREILRKLRFFIVPVSNPDGYEYTFSKNPRWRKNRRQRPHCKYVGTDCNRNYDFHWEQGLSKMNRNTYKGENPFSEAETRALRNALHKLEPNLLFFLSLHSYAQSIMYPWGYSKELPESWPKLQKLALTGRNAIKAYNGRQYKTGSIASLSKRTISGSIVDYAFGVVKVPLALVMELPSSEMGFQPPPESISPIGHESWFGIREMCKVAYDLVPAYAEPNDKNAEKSQEVNASVATDSTTDTIVTTANASTTTDTTANDLRIPKSKTVKDFPCVITTESPVSHAAITRHIIGINDTYVRN